MAWTAESVSYLQVHNRAYKCYAKYCAVYLGIDIWKRNFFDFCYTSKETKRMNLRPSTPGLYFSIYVTDCFVKRCWLYGRLLQRIADRSKSLCLQAVNLGLYRQIGHPFSFECFFDISGMWFWRGFMYAQQNPLQFQLRLIFDFPKSTAESVGMLFANQSVSLANYRSPTVTF